MKQLALAALIALFASATANAQENACPPAGYDRARLEALRAAEWEIADAGERERFALALGPCLASPDPFLRDRVAYEALTRMLRAEQLSADVRTHLTNDILARLEARLAYLETRVEIVDFDNEADLAEMRNLEQQVRAEVAALDLP